MPPKSQVIFQLHVVSFTTIYTFIDVDTKYVIIGQKMVCTGSSVASNSVQLFIYVHIQQPKG
jgi:hypothetical protein